VSRKFLPLFAASLALLVGAPLLSGCKGTKVEQISRVIADPTSFQDKDVVVAGRVVRRFDPSQGLLAVSAYQVEDKTGRIWVVSRTGAPSIGSEVGLKGRINRDLNLGSLASQITGVVLNEVERKTR